jgi:hypothetical protein
LFSFVILSANFKPEQPLWYPGSKFTKIGDVKVTKDEVKSAVYKSIMETDKQKYIIGEPILYKILVKPENNKNGWTLDSINFTIKGHNAIYESNLYPFEGRLYKFLINWRYIVLPGVGWGVTEKGNFYQVSHANIFTYFKMFPNLQIQIKPGKYWIIFNLKNLSTMSSTVLPCSINVEIDSVPDNEKKTFDLLKNEQYQNIFDKYPKSVYAPYAKFRYLLNIIKKYCSVSDDNKVSKSKYGEKIKRNYYELIKYYPEYSAGEVGMMEYIFQDVLYFSVLNGFPKNALFDTLITPEMEEYFDEFKNLKDNEMAIFLKWKMIDRYEYFKKMDRKRYERFKEKTSLRKKERLEKTEGEKHE